MNLVRQLFQRGGSDPTNKRRRRYTNGDAEITLEDISDPHSREDETKTSLKTWLLENKWFIGLGLPVGLGITAILLYYIWRVAPQVATNRWVQGSVAGVVYTGLIVVGSVRYYRSNRDNHDTLELDLQEGSMELRGWYIEDEGESGADMFVPALGVNFFGKRTGAMTMGHFPHSLSETWAKMNRDMDDVATIRLTGSHEVLRTDFGTTIQDNGTELRIDEFSRASVMRVVPPDRGDTHDLQNLKEQLVATEQELQAKRNELSAARRQNEDMQELAEETQEQAMKRFLRSYMSIRTVDRGRDGRQQQMPALEFDETGDPMVDQWMREMDDQLAFDDEQ